MLRFVCDYTDTLLSTKSIFRRAAKRSGAFHFTWAENETHVHTPISPMHSFMYVCTVHTQLTSRIYVGRIIRGKSDRLLEGTTRTLSETQQSADVDLFSYFFTLCYFHYDLFFYSYWQCSHQNEWQVLTCHKYLVSGPIYTFRRTCRQQENSNNVEPTSHYWSLNDGTMYLCASCIQKEFVLENKTPWDSNSLRSNFPILVYFYLLSVKSCNCEIKWLSSPQRSFLVIWKSILDKHFKI